MSIASEITRLQNAKASLKTSIENKGVTVSSSAKLDDYASLVDSIVTQPNLQNKRITPTTSEQIVQADENYYGLDTVTVEAVALEQCNVTPTTSSQTLSPTSPNVGFNEVNVSAVTSSIDANIQAENIKKDVSILGVTGSYEGGRDPFSNSPMTSFLKKTKSTSETAVSYFTAVNPIPIKINRAFQIDVDSRQMTELTEGTYEFYKCNATNVKILKITIFKNNNQMYLTVDKFMLANYDAYSDYKNLYIEFSKDNNFIVENSIKLKLCDTATSTTITVPGTSSTLKYLDNPIQIDGILSQLYMTSLNGYFVSGLTQSTYLTEE